MKCQQEYDPNESISCTHVQEVPYGDDWEEHDCE